MARPLTSKQSDTATTYIGVPVSRVDGRMKVTGTAKYAAEYNVPGLLHGYVIGSPIAKGRIRRIDVRDALAVEGVIDVFTHEHRPRLASADDNAYEYARIYAQWGDKPKALQCLERAVRVRDPGLVHLKVEADLDPLRDEPRFQAIERDLKFPT